MRKNTLGVFESLEQRMVLAGLNGWNIDAINLPINQNNINSSVVAIIDSGADINHEFLRNNIWNNPYDLPDGIDNDNNGYVDDSNGWDFAGKGRVVEDGYGHGTHVAGIIKNIDPNVKLMILKFQDNNGVGYTGDAISAIKYAIDMKIKGINITALNLSWGGGTGRSSLLESAIKNADDLGINVVTAAGNSASDNDIIARYPSGYKFQNTIAVAAASTNGLASFSNYGKNTVDIAAPGTSILSSLPNGNYGYMSGTSMAAPSVTGAVSLLKSLTNYSSYAIKEALLKTASLVNNLYSKVYSGLLNVGAAYNNLMGYSNTTVSSTPTNSSNPIVSVTTSPVLSSKIVYAIDGVSKRNISGWVMDVNNTDKRVVVVIKINNRVVYRAISNGSRGDLNNGYGFSLNPKNYLRLKKNLVAISYFDSVTQKTVIIGQRWVNR